jgi:GNAT superfamily N-acetyltransferase
VRMPDPPKEHARLAALLPDVPRFVETRGMLLEGRCEVLGLERGPSPSFVTRDGEEKLVCVVGSPTRDAISEAVARNGDAGEVIAMPENAARVAEALPGWRALPVVAHLLGESERLPEAPEGAVRFLSGPEDIGHLPPGLRAELERALRGGTPVAAAFVGGDPVSFCYAGWETERLWDVSIDTLDGYRRRGYAAWCAAYAIRHMRALGKQPAWHALESNTASMELAARLGFVPVDRFFLFEPPRSA